MAVFFTKYLFFLSLLSAGLGSQGTSPHSAHPYYVSVTEIAYSQPDQEIQIAVKIFTDDFEQALKGMYKTKEDLIHPPDKPELHKKISGYIRQHVRIMADNQPVNLRFIGYEIEGEAAWCYFSAKQTNPAKTVEVENSLLYEYKKEQINIVHVRMSGVRRSARLSYPDTLMQFSF